jgi:pimeloyl-ACP methyl ester carboxylesterase
LAADPAAIGLRAAGRGPVGRTAMPKKTIERTLDAMPDTVDFRDAMYSPALIEVPPVSDLAGYRKSAIPVLDQGKEGACTGFGLATVANYLLRDRGKKAAADEVSAWMLYAMAKRYDEWPGEEYSGSSARGAMKGWHKHGVCASRLWKDATGAADLDEQRAADAITRPMGAYFRVNHRDLVAMHAAISEVGILYATARVHAGWQQVREGDQEIAYSPDVIGGHAFAIVGYDREGLWIQNSWGPAWGSGGIARVRYGDWLENGTDVWVAALGVPVELGNVAAPASIRSAAPRSHEGYVYSALRPHIVTARNDGELDPKGVYGLTQEGLRSIVEEQMPRRMEGWARKRVMLHAHGGLVPEGNAVQYVANNREAALAAQVYPLSFIWRSDAWSTIRNILQEALSRRRDEGLLDKAKDFMLDRLDDTLEPIARLLGGKAMWDEMKENAKLATTGQRGAARLAADLLIRQHGQEKLDEIHLVGHSAGAIFQAYLAQYLTDKKVPVESLTLWAPACTFELFEEIYRPRIEAGQIRAFRLFTLDDAAEQDDHCANIYHKSLLCLVSHAFERKPRIPLIQSGTRLLGLERDVKKEIPKGYWDGQKRRWFVSPAAAEADATQHGDFDNDAATLAATLKMVTGGAAPAPASLAPRPPSASRMARRRQTLDSALGGNALFR